MNYVLILRFFIIISVTLSFLGCTNSEINPYEGLIKFNVQTERDLDPDAATEDVQQLVTDNTTFALELYHQQMKKPLDDNIIFSPLLLSLSMAMISLGASGEVESTIRSGIRSTLSSERFHHTMNKLGIELGKRVHIPKVELSFDVLHCLDQSLTIQPDYAHALFEFYGAPLYQANFRSNSNQIRDVLNQWISDRTKGMLNQVIPNDTISSDTRYALAAATFFKGEWLHLFNKEDTKPLNFYLLDGSIKRVDTMYRPENVGFRSATYTNSSNKTATVVDLSYKFEEVSMLVVMPNETFQPFCEDFSVDDYHLICSRLQINDGELYLPKWYFDFTMDKNTIFETLGINLDYIVFDNIVNSGSLTLNELIHKSIIKVDEEGTVFASTVNFIFAVSAPPVVRIDKPFLFFIRDRITNTILFMGHVIDPSRGLTN